VILTLQNGDRLTGELKSETTESLILQHPVAGVLTLPKSQITRREQLKPAAPAAAQPTAPVRAAASPPMPDSPATNAAAELSPEPWLPGWIRPFTTNWHGKVQVGLDLGFGTSDRQTFYANAEVNHTYGRLRNFAEYHLAYGTTDGREAANRMNGQLKTDVDLFQSRRLYVYHTAGAGYDEVRQISLEFNEGAGMGYKVLQRPRLALNLELGMQYQNLNYVNAPNRDFVSARAGESLTWKVTDKLSLTQRLSFLPNVDNFADYRLRFDLSASYPLLTRVTLNLNVIDQYDSRPPPNVDSNDLQIQSTVGLTF